MAIIAKQDRNNKKMKVIYFLTYHRLIFLTSMLLIVEWVVRHFFPHLAHYMTCQYSAVNQHSLHNQK